MPARLSNKGKKEKKISIVSCDHNLKFSWMWINLLNSTPWELLHIPHPWHHVSVKSNRKQPGKVKVYILWAALFINPFAVFLEDVAGFVISVGGMRGAWMSVNKPVKQPLSTFVLATILVCDFAVVVLVRCAAQQPASGSELQDLQQQQTGHGGEALLQQEAVP